VSERVQAVLRVPAFIVLLLEVPGKFVLEFVLFDQEQHIRDKEDACEREKADAYCGCHFDLWIIGTCDASPGMMFVVSTPVPAS
jgi:hypothetical protein